MTAGKVTRRRALQLGIPAAGMLYAVGLTELLSCKNKTATKNNTVSGGPQRKPKKTPVQRGNPYAGRDEMFLHHKSKALHYPFVFKTYDTLKPGHFTSVNTNDWQKQLDENGAHFTKDGSGLIFERLALRHLKEGVNNETLSRASSILERSFTGDYAKQNKYNWRGYHLLSQMMALNSAVADADKWNLFSNGVKETKVADIKKIPKRHAWIASQQLFEQRAQYIHQHADEYMNRIKKRLV